MLLYEAHKLVLLPKWLTCSNCHWQFVSYVGMIWWHKCILLPNYTIQIQMLFLFPNTSIWNLLAIEWYKVSMTNCSRSFYVVLFRSCTLGVCGLHVGAVGRVVGPRMWGTYTTQVKSGAFEQNWMLPKNRWWQAHLLHLSPCKIVVC